MANLAKKFDDFRKRHALPKKFRKPLAVISLLVWAFAASVVSQYIIGYLLLWTVGAGFFHTFAGIVIYQLISYALSLFIAIFIPWRISKKGRTSREELGLNGLPTWTDIGLAPLGFIASILLALAITALFSLIMPFIDFNEAQELGYSVAMSAPERVISFLVVVVIVPIIEETIYRGWLYGKLRAKLGMVLSIFLTSLFFGLAHLQWNVGINVFAVSIVLCGLRELTGTIYAGILVHMIKNGVAFFLVYILGIS